MNIQKDWHCGPVGEAADDAIQQQLVRRAHIPGQPGALSGDMTVEALPTYYDGVTFRSALEASWAATLDTLDIAWEYEPETITLPSGTTYIPDFRLPDIGAWLEVKGPGVPRVEKAFEFAASLACGCRHLHCDCRWPGGELVLVGHPPKRYDAWSDPAMEGATYKVMRNRNRRHGGHPNWTSTRPRTAWLTRCIDCDRGSWFDTNKCRACQGPLAGCHGYRPGEDGLEFRRIKGPARKAEPAEEAEAN